MASKDTFQEPGNMNSSYVVFFHAAILFVVPYILAIFPSELRSDAFMVGLVFPVVLFWFSYLMKQFVSASLVMWIVLGAVFTIAALSFLNAVYGHLSSESVPVFYTELFLFASLLAGLSGPVGLIYAGTIMAYGAYAYILCVAIAALFESIYNLQIRRWLPKSVLRGLKQTDAKIDRQSIRVSDQYFAFNQNIGLAICLVLIALYALLYIVLLIK